MLLQDGNTPLHIAALNNMPSVVDVLLKSKADADCVNKVLWNMTLHITVVDMLFVIISIIKCVVERKTAIPAGYGSTDK
jgi:hypothetical protein